MNNYHTRNGYERLYCRLLTERGEPVSKNLRFFSGYELLSFINIELVKQNCIPFSFAEIKDIQSKI
jgi:hypothetical protein